jgi:alpha-L-fucosidase 2
MHLDINTQMNYWPSLVTGLSETDEPLFHWIKEDLSKAGTVTAKESYGLDGWVGELVSNAWGYAAPYWASPIAPCPTGGVWVMMQMWEYYLYCEDLEFLKEYAFPLMESAVKFFDAYLFLEKDSQYYTCGPSISPENSFIYKGSSYQISNGCTYEILMIRELFSIYIRACVILNKPSTNLQHNIHAKLERLMPYRIKPDGTIAEWNHNLDVADTQHRHTSHLLGLFPFAQITPEETPDLCEAAKKTLQQKLIPMENWEDTGWARSMLMLYEARLRDGEKAYQHIKSMLNNLLEPNDMIYHPPTRGAGAFDHVYELDGNTGLTSCIAEMLLQSHKGIIHLLPALPKEWETGRISGLKARGNITVEIAWEKGKMQYAKLVSKQDKKVTVAYAEQRFMLELKQNTPYILRS